MTARATVVLAVLLLSSASCKKVSATVTDHADAAAGASSGDSGASSGAAASAAEDSRAFNKKLNPYVKCVNEFSRDVRATRHNYLDEVNAKTGPTGKEHHPISVVPLLDDPKQCVDGINEAKTSSPSLPALEQAGAAYVAALLEVLPIVKDANDYYEHQKNKDDKAALGKSLHPKLMAAWEAFAKADDTLGAAIDVVEDQQQTKRLAMYQADPTRQLRYHHEKLLASAKKVLTIALASKEPKDVPLADFTAAVGVYETALNDLKKYAAEHGPEVAAVSAMTSFIDFDADNLLKSAQGLMRRRRDNVKYSDGELMDLGAGSSVPGSPGKVVADYNSLVEASNHLND